MLSSKFHYTDPTRPYQTVCGLVGDQGPVLLNIFRFIVRLFKFVIRLTYDSDLKRAKKFSQEYRELIYEHSPK